jgi:TusA-related sulfurtransferase
MNFGFWISAKGLISLGVSRFSIESKIQNLKSKIVMVKTLDARGESCPDPLTLTLKEMESLKVGDQLKVILDSPMALETISRWVERKGHKLLSVTEIGAAQWEMIIEKTAS